MKSIRILDCTLRDGGFVNDWNFGCGSIKSIVSRLDKAGIDMVEVGFIDERRPYDPDRSIWPDTQSVRPMLKGLEIDNAMILAMIDYGTCDINKISLQKDSCLDGIRVIFKKKDQDAALQYLARVKEKGYKIFVNPVSITGYSDEELISLLEKINKIEPYAVAIVDTYGLMHRKELLHYYRLFDKHINKSITIGYHSHNNFQLVYASAIELCDLESERDLVIDSSLFGMGKGAGNANTELIAMFYNDNFYKKFAIEHLLEAIDVDIMKEYAKTPWGYSLLHYLAASNDCHPEYVKYLISKRSLSIKSVNDLLESIPSINKLTFNKETIEKIYQGHLDVSCNDDSSYCSLTKDLANKNILLLGPGVSIINESDKILSYIKKYAPVVISINFVNELYKIDYVFMGNSKRYSQFFHKIYGDEQNCKVIATSNITESGKRIDYVFNYGSLSDDNETIRDNPLLMIIKILKKCDIKEITLAGFDGYTVDNEKNYYKEYIPLLYCQDDVLKRNSAIAENIKGLGKDLSIKSITTSMYF